MSRPEGPVSPVPADAVAQLLESIAHRVEALSATDPVAKPIQGLIHDVLGTGALRDALTGRWLGHAVHPVLTDLPIGFWTSAFTLDFIGGRRSRPAAQRLVGLGVLSALPTAAAGAADWSDTTGKARRVGLVHAALNSAAIVCFTASWFARRRGHHGRGVLYGLAGSAVATGGGFFGGHLVQRLGLAVDHTTFDELPVEWTSTRPAAEWVNDTPKRVEVDGTGIVVVREEGAWYGLAQRCSHAGGPLDEGEARDGCIECPWHGSRFRLHDGSVARGPAFAPQPVVSVRVHDEVVEVRDATAI
ncbi:MAG: Rieske 2Fe-2S domain-containing protein [Acidimicrobiia bacterium]